MRPPRLRLYFCPSHIFIRNNTYYYRINIPVDLQKHFPVTEIKKSLKTKDSKVAKVLAASLEYKVIQTFTLLRSGMLSNELIQDMVADLQPSCKAIKPRGMLLSTVMDEYVKMHEANWTTKTKIETVACHRLILEIIGDIEAKALTKQEVLAFRSKVMRLPANRYKIYPNKSISDVLDMPDVVPMSTKSANKHISRLCSLMSYCVKEGITQVNYAQGMIIPDRRRNDEERKAYDREDLQRVIDNLPRDEEAPERFWIPLISMYNGMRLDEICQLYLEDIHEIDGVQCFSVNDEKDKKAKTVSSKRIIPIHPKLLELGFIAYVASVRSKGLPRLWMNLKWREMDGYSNAFGKWYQKYNRAYVTEDRRKVFHSFRHTLANNLKQIGVQEIVIAEILGHTNDSMTMSRYGKRYEPKVLLEALKMLDYGIQIPSL